MTDRMRSILMTEAERLGVEGLVAIAAVEGAVVLIEAGSARALG